MMRSVVDNITPAYRWLFLLIVFGLVLIVGQSGLWGGFSSGGAEGRLLPVERPLILYFGFDEYDHDQIYVVSPTTGQMTQLTHTSLGVIDFSLSPDGATIAFSVRRDDGGSDLWAMDAGIQYPLLTCPGIACSGLVWTPDGAPPNDGVRLVYEQRLLLPDGTLGQPRLWWLDPLTGKTDPVFADETRYGFAAGWSPDGQWLSYLLPDTEGVQIHNIEDGRRQGGADGPL